MIMWYIQGHYASIYRRGVKAASRSIQGSGRERVWEEDPGYHDGQRTQITCFDDSSSSSSSERPLLVENCVSRPRCQHGNEQADALALDPITTRAIHYRCGTQPPVFRPTIPFFYLVGSMSQIQNCCASLNSSDISSSPSLKDNFEYFVVLT